jgi:N utilization substance protein B
MLNRRSLRIKAMQSLYAVQKCEEANFELAKASIDEFFAPDLNSMEVQDKVQLSLDAKIGKGIFVKSFNQHNIVEAEGTSELIRKAVSEAIDYFNTEVKKDKAFIKKNMMEAVNTLLENYYLSLKLMLEFAKLNKEEIEARKNRLIESNQKVFESELNLFNNKAIKILEENVALSNEFIRMKVSWDDESLSVRQWYREILKQEEFYKIYTLLSNPSFADDVEVLDKIYKQVIIKNETLADFMAERDLYWAENKSALKSMLKKTFKSLEEGSDHVELIELSANWEDDSEFFQRLFAETVANDEEYEDLIAKYTKNWSKERITTIDMIIIKMAVCEMLKFPSIPVKVTINEYIDLSKNYSTLKSKVFVNGMLDKLSEELKKEGKVKKSGRGLMDNK